VTVSHQVEIGTSDSAVVPNGQRAESTRGS
jgi:hypothetical protein